MNPQCLHTPSPLVIACKMDCYLPVFHFCWREGEPIKQLTNEWKYFWFELHAIVLSVLIFWCTLEKSWISELTRGLQTLATSWQITKHIDLHPPSQLELDAHLPHPSSPHVLEWNLHVKKCKLLSIRFTIDVWQGTGFHKAITVPCITFLHLQHV